MKRISQALLSAALVLAFSAATAHAQFLGVMRIKGDRYVNGDVLKVKCGPPFQNNLIDWTATNTRIVTIDPACPLHDDIQQVTFRGREADVFKNGVQKHEFIFTGILGTATDESGPIRGSILSELRYTGEALITLKLDKGQIEYNYKNGLGQQVQFVGTYSADCDDNQGSGCSP